MPAQTVFGINAAYVAGLTIAVLAILGFVMENKHLFGFTVKRVNETGFKVGDLIISDGLGPTHSISRPDRSFQDYVSRVVAIEGDRLILRNEKDAWIYTMTNATSIVRVTDYKFRKVTNPTFIKYAISQTPVTA